MTSDERTGQPGACPFFVLWPAGHQRERSDRTTPRYPYTVAEVTRFGFEIASRVGRGHFQNRNPGPAGPRPDTQSGPEGARGRDSRGAARTPPRSPAGRAGRPHKGAPMRTGAPKPRRAHGAERVGTTNISRARRSVVLGAETWGGTTTPPRGDT